MWLDVPKSTLIIIEEVTFYTHFLAIANVAQADINAAEAIHSAQHAFLHQFAMSADLRTECKAAEKEYKKVESSRKRPARYGVLLIFPTPPFIISTSLIFYDTPGKGGGVAAKAFDQCGSSSLMYPTFTDRFCSLRDSS